jgi:protocatechuate 3,4-dioxygenase beta subunit
MTRNAARLRRRLLIGAGTVAVTAGALTVWRKPLTRMALATVVDNSRFDRTSLSFEDTATCSLTSQAVEGPFYVPDSPLRSDIRDGQPGHDLRLRLKLVDATTCEPMAHAAVHIWQANASGFYSGYASHSPDAVELTPRHVAVESAERFLRGHQFTDAQGMVEYRTILPAWYSFRTPHIHVKALLADRSTLSTQLYFPEDLNTLVRTTEAPYLSRPQPLVNNRSDPVIRASRGAGGGWPKMTADGDGHVASLTIAVAKEPAPANATGPMR